MDVGAADSRRRRDSVIAGVVGAVVTVGLGLVGIGRSFGYDEGITYHFFINEGSVRRALTTQVVFNNHPMFSAIQAVAWQLGLRGETVQRLGPVLCGAVTVGAVVWYTARRVGMLGGAAAGVVLVGNLVFIEQVRQLRGYALATMAVFLAAIAIQRSWHDTRLRWLVAQGVLMVVAVTTHAYSAVTLAMVAVAALALGRVERRHLVTWALAAVTALAVMAPLLDDMRRNAEARGNLFYSDFPFHLVRSLTGREWVAVVVVSIAALAGAVDLAGRSRRHTSALLASGGVLVAVVLLVWLVLQPRDLYFRFFVSVIPFVAVLAGRGIAQLSRAGALCAIGLVVFSLAPPLLDVLDDDPPFRDAAVVAERARDAGLELCARQAEPLRVYTAPIRLINGIGDFDDCEVFVSVLGTTEEQRSAARARFTGEFRMGGTVVIWADAAVIDDLVAGISPRE